MILLALVVHVMYSETSYFCAECVQLAEMVSP